MPILSDIPFQIDRSALFKRLRLDPESEFAGEINAVADLAAAAARPKALYEVAFVEARGENTVTVKGVTFTSRVLRQNLEKVERVFLHIVTCGHELDAIAVAADDLVGQFCRDAIKEMALVAGRSHLRRHLKHAYGLSKLSVMSPGSGDRQIWPIEQQRQLFACFGDVQRLIGVRLTDTCLMLPNKTVSGLFFPSEVDFLTCQLCHRPNCPNRQAPFDEPLWRERNPDAAAPPRASA